MRSWALALVVLLAACEPLEAPAEPRGWSRFSSVPALNSPEFSIAAPPGWHGEPTDDHEVVMYLEGPEPRSFGLSVRRFLRITADGDEWLSDVEKRVGLGVDQLGAEWLDLPGGRARHGSMAFGEFYLFRAADEDAVIMLWFSSFDKPANADDLARNRALADTFRFEPSR